uniref:Uncharacterized protein n=1 Tax=Romanomermis culicivorax TaxID=13658 RepID=A0A915IIS1_ROMCU
MAEMLEEIRWKSKLAWRSNIVDMNYKEYYEDAPADSYDNKYWRRYDPEMVNWIPQEEQRDRVDPKDL